MYRLASLFSNEKGPYRVFSKFRVWAGETIAHDGTRHGRNEFARGLICLWCFSIWVGVGVSIAYYFYPAITLTVAVPFALSAVATVLDR